MKIMHREMSTTSEKSCYFCVPMGCKFAVDVDDVGRPRILLFFDNIKSTYFLEIASNIIDLTSHPADKY